MGGWKMSELGQKCVESWRRVMPDYQIKIWTDENAPDSPWRRCASRTRPVNASHWTQWAVLLREGGVFFDNDIEAVRPLDLNHAAFTGFQRSDTCECCINNAVFGCEPGHPVAKEILRRIEASDPGGFPLVSGPGIPTDVLHEWGLVGLNVEQKVRDVMVYDKERFYPFWYTEPIDRSRLTPRTFAIHLWGGTWNKK